MKVSTSLVIETSDLTKSYKGVRALQSLDLRVPRNSIFAFLGPNGAGKTTTIKVLLGLAKPTHGRATIFGLDILRDSANIRRRVGYLAQEPHYYEHMTARETLRFTARFFFSGPAASIEARVAETLALVGLEGKADRPVKGFSGGERQRLGIVQAQVNHPDLLILDEPAASLDPQGRHDVLEVMERLRKHTTIFYSTHILSDVQRVSDTVAILDRGQLIAQAPIEELLADGGTAYLLVVAGNVEAASARIASQPWVTSIQTASNNGHTRWQVAVNDDTTAQKQLLPLVQADGDVTVLEFSRKTADLEQVFLNLTKGEHDVKR